MHRDEVLFLLMAIVLLVSGFLYISNSNTALGVGLIMLSAIMIILVLLNVYYDHKTNKRKVNDVRNTPSQN